jgi:microcystin-dependent protein
MAEPFLAEIRIMSFVFPPKGWALCNGQLLAINTNQALFSLLGTTYGGDGRVNFGLPNLQGLIPIHMGQGHTIGERGGEQAHTLSISEIPTHIHFANATQTTTGTTNLATSSLMLGPSKPQSMYGAATNFIAMSPSTVTNIGGSQAHINQQPFLTLSFCIALQGIFPSQN